MKLSDLGISQKAKIISFSKLGDKQIKQRLRDMGVVKGEIITVKKKAPLGDPIEILVKQYSLTLRKVDASLIEVELHD
jgi:ferrous iron transport protein A